MTPLPDLFGQKTQNFFRFLSFCINGVGTGCCACLAEVKPINAPRSPNKAIVNNSVRLVVKVLSCIEQRFSMDLLTEANVNPVAIIRWFTVLMLRHLVRTNLGVPILSLHVERTKWRSLAI